MRRDPAAPGGPGGEWMRRCSLQKRCHCPYGLFHVPTNGSHQRGPIHQLLLPVRNLRWALTPNFVVFVLRLVILQIFEAYLLCAVSSAFKSAFDVRGVPVEQHRPYSHGGGGFVRVAIALAVNTWQNVGLFAHHVIREYHRCRYKFRLVFVRFHESQAN